MKILAATTTLARGVNFPLFAAVVESLSIKKRVRGQWVHEDMPPEAFWNLAGRTGRALVDPVGTVALVIEGNKEAGDIRAKRYAAFAGREADQVTSALLDLLAHTAKAGPLRFTVSELAELPALSAFLQFVLHAVSTSSLSAVAANLDGLLRSSLVHAQARSHSPAAAAALLQLGQDYVKHLRSRSDASLDWQRSADGTGFSSPSVDFIYARSTAELRAASPADWGPRPPPRASSETMLPGPRAGNRWAVREQDHESGVAHFCRAEVAHFC